MNGRADEPAADHDHPSREECAFTEEHAAGYALGTLDRFERGLVEHHLRWCDRCRELVSAAERVTALLPLLSPPVAPPSPTVRSTLMERIAADGTGPIVAVPPVSSRPAPVSGPVETDPVSRASTRNWSRILPAALVVPLTIALIGVLAWANSLQNTIEERTSDLANQQQLNGAIETVGGVQMYSMEPLCTDCIGSSRLGVDMDDNVGMLVAWNLDPKKEHSVWCVDSNGEKSWISTLDVDPRGGAMQAFTFPGKASNYSEVYIASDNGSVAYMTNIATPPSRGADDYRATPSTPDPGPDR